MLAEPFDLSGWSRRDEAAHQAGAARVAQVRGKTAELQALFAEYGVGEAYLFGSIARGEARADSDVDIAVAQCPPEVFYRLASKLERALDLPLDLIDLDRAPQDITLEVRGSGERLYPPEPLSARATVPRATVPRATVPRAPGRARMTKSELRVLRAQLLAERARLTEVVVQLKALQESLGEREPTLVELMAAGGFLHNVYNGIENCLTRLAHGVDESVPSGNESHRLLIDQMSEPLPSLRPALLSRELAARIDEYRRFRHAFRHMYFFDLEWARLQPLASGAPALLTDFEHAVEELLAQLGA